MQNIEYMKQLLKSVSFAGAQQNATVKGKILDSEGIPLEGVGVIVKGISQGVSSTGESELKINVIMIESQETLEEVTLVAFGKQKKESVLASISTVRSSELKIPSSILSTALAGRIAGLVSYQSSGEPSLPLLLYGSEDSKGRGSALRHNHSAPRQTQWRSLPNILCRKGAGRGN
jgi:hypothetical protein